MSEFEKALEKVQKKHNDSSSKNISKTGRVLDLKEKVLKMISLDLSLPAQIEILKEAELLEISLPTYRKILEKYFNKEYTELLERNGWLRQKKQKTKSAPAETNETDSDDGRMSYSTRETAFNDFKNSK